VPQLRRVGRGNHVSNPRTGKHWPSCHCRSGLHYAGIHGWRLAIKGTEGCIGFGSGVLIDRESNGWFVASIPDLSDLAGFGGTDERTVAQVAELARETEGHCRKRPASSAATPF
jgi:hypothetical protein